MGLLTPPFTRPPPTSATRLRPRFALAVLSSCFAALAAACGEPVADPKVPAARALNRLELSPQTESGGYRVVIVGHAYGNFRDKKSHGPAASLIEHIAEINELNPSFTLLLGDFVRNPSKPFVQALRQRLAAKLQSPLFVAPGEHDLIRGGGHYERLFGPRYYSLRKGAELFLVLDTGGAAKGQTELLGDQRVFVQTLLRAAASDAEIRNVIVLIHKVLWVERERYRELSTLVNNHRKGGFWGALYPQLRRLASSKSVYVGAGDIGHLSYSFLVDRDPEDGITYFATGLADRPWDSVALMHFLANGDVELGALSLSDRAIDSAATGLEGFARWRADAGALR